MKIYIDHYYASNRVKLYAFDDSSNYEYNLSMKDGLLHATAIDKEKVPVAGETYEPLLDMPLDLWTQFKSAMLKHMSDNGEKTENENTLQGTMKAQQLHLEDMRKFTELLINNLVK